MMQWAKHRRFLDYWPKQRSIWNKFIKNMKQEVRWGLDKVHLGKLRRECACLRNMRDLKRSRSQVRSYSIKTHRISFTNAIKKILKLKRAFNKMMSSTLLDGISLKVMWSQKQNHNKRKMNLTYTSYWMSLTLQFAITTGNSHKLAKRTTCAAKRNQKASLTEWPGKTIFIWKIYRTLNAQRRTSPKTYVFALKATVTSSVQHNFTRSVSLISQSPLSTRGAQTRNKTPLITYTLCLDMILVSTLTLADLTRLSLNCTAKSSTKTVSMIWNKK